MELIDRTTQYMDRGETPFGIFLDLSEPELHNSLKIN